MLEVIQIESRSQIAEIFSRFNPREQTWLVSDLRTKFELQQKILARDGQYVDESVLRASDLWKILLKRVEPRLRLVSDPFARSLLRTVMDQYADDLGVNSSAADTVFSYIDQMAGIIFHPDGTTRLNDWFQTHPEAMNRWKDWYLRARFCAVKLLEDHRVITSDWITAYLQNATQLEQMWSSALIIDLSSEISRVEADIFRAFSRVLPVTILEPRPTWHSEYNFLLRPYEDLRMQSQKVETLRKPAVGARQTQVLRFSGMLGEVKHCVGQIRHWLEEGVAANSIAVIAPDIEAYWPVLQAFLQQEGVPCQKDITHKLQNLPAVNRWLATLRTQSGRLSSTDLEISFFDKNESQGLRFEEFKSLFQSLYVTEDLSRNELVHKLYYEQIDLSGFVSRDIFVGKAMSLSLLQESEVVQTILRELLQNATAGTQLSWKDWMSYLESIVSIKEYTLEKGVSDGVLVTKIMSAHTEKAQRRIFLGLSDEALKTKSKSHLMNQDYFDLSKDLGFYLDNPDQNDLEFELRFLAEADSAEDIYCFGVTDLGGSLQAPAKFWLSATMNLTGFEAHEDLTLPLETRWDELQGTHPLQERPWFAGRRDSLESRIRIDLGQEPLPALQTAELPRISISSLENYLQCPFTFAAQRYFRLQDLPNIDLDVDHRTRGQLAHALFEKLTEEPLRFDWSGQELDELLENIRQGKELIFADERIWVPVKKKHLQIARRFLDFEKKWRQEFHKTHTLAREKRFEFHIDPQTQEILKEARENTFRISGQIDRIDGDQKGSLVLLDYKSSAGGISASGSWLKNRELQLLFYSWVIEKSLVEDIQGEVIGLFYYLFKTFERKGFKIEDQAGSLYPPAKRKDKNSNQVVKEKYLAELTALIMETLQRIQKGEIAPQPLDFTNCKTCEWRRLCRAPHLN